MKFLLCMLFLNVAVAEVVCVNNVCKEVAIESPSTGSSLLDFNQEQKDSVEPVKLDEGDKLPHYKYQDNYAALKLSEVSAGQCLIDPKKMVFYKILKLDRSKKMVEYVVEAKNHEYSLRTDVVFWNQPQAYAFKQLKKWDCIRTPNLHDNDYVKKCTKGIQKGDALCSPPSRI